MAIVKNAMGALLLALLTSCLVRGQTGSPDTTVLMNLRKLDKKSFIGKEIKDFLAEETVGRYFKKSFVTEPPHKLSALLLTYGNEIEIMLVPEELKFQSSYSNFNMWDFELFKKEKIARIGLSYKGKLVEKAGR